MPRSTVSVRLPAGTQSDACVVEAFCDTSAPAMLDAPSDERAILAAERHQPVVSARCSSRSRRALERDQFLTRDSVAEAVLHDGCP
jgi:hypothetical protein